MENISELKQHLHAVTQTRQISNAMYLLSTSRIRKSMQNIDYNLTYMRLSLIHISEPTRRS